MDTGGEYHSLSSDDTIRWGENFAQLLKPGSAVFLLGSLGAGKTTMTRGLVRGLGYHGLVTSPSFSLIKIYPGLYPIYHCDLYRLQPGDNLRDLGMEEILSSENIAIFEWSEKFPFAQTISHWEITIDFTNKDEQRIISWKWLNRA